MNKVNNIWTKIRRKWMKICLQPIRVYCMHHVCVEFDASSMNRADWFSLTDFKTAVLQMQKDGVEIISLTDAYKHICLEYFRTKRYAVLTFDDGYTSLNEVLPWLEEQHIPATLFINGKYLDGKSYRRNPKERYLTRDELFALTSPLIEIGNHGWEHTRVTEMKNEEFDKSVNLCTSLLSQHPNYIPFWAYTYGSHTQHTDEFLEQNGLIPVYIEGTANYNDKTRIHRELL